MPLPEPKNNESKNEFISRCMKSNAIQTEFEEQDQKVAVCFSQWERKDESHIINRIDKILGEETVTGDVATYAKPISMGNDSFIKRQNKKWIYTVKDEEIDSDEDLEKLKLRIKKVK